MRKILTIALAATSIVLAACGDSSGPDSISGTYTLRTVNGQQLPFITDEDETYKAEILSMAITLKADETYSAVFTGRSTDNGQPTTNTVPFSGTYSLTGSTLTLDDSEGFLDPDGSVNATLSTDTITMVIEGLPGTFFTLVFKR